jgi:hypothetical protein
MQEVPATTRREEEGMGVHQTLLDLATYLVEGKTPS